MLFLLALMMVLYDLWDFDQLFPTWYCLIVKPKKSKPTFPLHSSFRSRPTVSPHFAPGSSRNILFLQTNGVSRLQTNKPDGTCRSYCHGHTFPQAGRKRATLPGAE